MSEKVSELVACEQAVARLRAEFPDVPERVVLEVFRGYHQRLDAVTAAEGAARQRIADACAIA